MTEPAEDFADIELGPIDFIVIEYANGMPTGEALPYLLDLIDRDLIRVLDFGLVARSQDGSHRALDLRELGAAGDAALSVFDGAQTGLLDDEDLAQVAGVIGNGSVGAIIVYENTWAAPFATALRRAGAQLVSSGRIPVQAVLEALEASAETEGE